MTDWKLVRIYTTNIIRITEKAALIAMPAKSKYAGYTLVPEEVDSQRRLLK